jgi:hypothetical protein
MVPQRLLVPLLALAAATGAQAQESAQGPRRIVVVAQPTSTSPRVVILPPIVVRTQDTAGNAVLYSGSVTMAIGRNVTGGTLAGTRIVRANGGLAIFRDLQIDRPGTGYTLVASAPGYASAETRPFNVLVPTSARPSLSVRPSTITATSGAGTATITVMVRDSLGRPMADVPVRVTVSGNGNVYTPSSPTTNSSGVFTATVSSTETGVKTVSAAMGDGTPLGTATVTVLAGAAARLGFTSQPSNTAPGDRINPAVGVTVLDAFGNVVTNFLGRVTVTIATGPREARLSGATVRPAASGIVTFADLSIDRSGSYSLRASSSGMTPVVSQEFSIGAR